MARTYLDLQNEVLGNDFDPQTYRPLVKTWINEALHRIARRVHLPQLEVIYPFATANGTASYALPADEVRDLSLREPSTSTPLEEIAYDELDAADASTDKPLFFARYGLNLILYPTPDAAYALELRYLKNTPELAADAEIPAIPGDYSDACVSYARSRAFRAEDDRQQADAFMADFDRAVNELRADIGKRGRGRKQIPSMWDTPPAPTFVRPT